MPWPFGDTVEEAVSAPHPLDYNPGSAEDPEYLAVTAEHDIHDRSRYNDGTNDDVREEA